MLALLTTHTHIYIYNNHKPYLNIFSLNDLTEFVITIIAFTFNY